MKKQALLAGAAVIIVLILFYFGRTVSDKKPEIPAMVSTAKSFDIESYIGTEKQKLTPSQAVTLTQIENNITRGDIPTQKIASLTAAANFWKDSINNFEAYAFYLSAAAKLDNSEKNLTFAALIILNNLRGEQDEAKMNWESSEAISLFEKAIEINPGNEDLKIGLGSCYVFGKGRNGDPQQTMKGIQELLGVVRRDSTNMKAQLVLGIGGYVSGQYDKAIARLTKVVTEQPNNLEAVAFLADTYAAQGNKEAAVKWYTISKRLANDPSYSKEVDERIKVLQK